MFSLMQIPRDKIAAYADAMLAQHNAHVQLLREQTYYKYTRVGMSNSCEHVIDYYFRLWAFPADVMSLI